MFINKSVNNSIRIPTIILSLYFLLSPIEYSLNFGHGTLLRYISVIFIISTSLIILSKKNIKLNDSNKKILIRGFILFAFYFLSIIWSVDKEQSFSMLLTYSLLILQLLSILFLDIYDEEKKIVENFIILGGVLSIIVIFFTANQVFGNNRFSINEADPNEFAALIILPFFITLKRLLSIKGISILKILHVIILITLIYIILMTGSRGALLSIILTFLYLLYTSKQIKLFIGFLLSIFIFIFFIYYLIPEFIIDRYFGKEIYEIDSEQGRTSLWIYYYNNVLGEFNILLGVGLACVGYVYKSYFSQLVATHNTYLQMFTEFGSIGLTIFISFLYSIYKKIIQNKDIFNLALFFSILFIIFFLDAIHKRYLWNILMFCVISYKISTK